ncbi:hypothetical protein PENSPDRAFT_709330 [Peniophora sp. CONT]|nr:hypothetical protein PENSPDRAFT_709330 [Peniophora sp. CONT]
MEETSNRDSDHGEAWKAFIRSRFDTSNAHGGGRATRVAALDRELATVEKEMAIYLALAKKHRNAGVMSCSLPAEVLTTVFLFASRLSDWQPTKLGGKIDSGWTNLVHVCSLWRQVSLNAAILWSEIPCFGLSRKIALPYLLRSKGLPLALTFNALSLSDYPSGAEEKDIAQDLSTWLCLPICRRVRRLSVQERGGRYEKRSWSSLLEQSMPHIEEISFELVYSYSSWQPVILTPKSLASSRPSKLHELRLKNIFICATSPIWLANLTTLSLIFCSTPNASALPSIARFREMLSRFTALSVLVLENMFPGIDDSGEQDQDALELPDSLATVEFVADSQSSKACLTLLLGLKIPAHAACFINVDGKNVEQSILLRVVTHLQPKDWPVRSIYLSTYSLRVKHDSEWFTPYAIVEKRGEIDESTRYFSYGAHTDQSNPARVRALTPLMNWSNADSLALTSGVISAFTSVPDCLALLSSATLVTTFSLSYNSAAFHILCALADSLDERLRTPALLPKLWGLALYRDPSYDLADNTRLHLALMELLQSRKLSQVPILKLFIVGDLITEEEEARIRELVTVERMGYK